MRGETVKWCDIAGNPALGRGARRKEEEDEGRRFKVKALYLHVMLGDHIIDVLG